MRGPAPELGEVIELAIDDLAYGGAGVGRRDGFVVFVHRSVPGDTVRAQISVRRGAYAEAELQAVLQPSPFRVEPPCPYFVACGGCQWMQIAYERQLEAKAQIVRASLQRLGQVGEVAIAPIVAAPQPFGYRNKMEFVVGEDGEGRPVIGLHHAADPFRITPIDRCMIQGEEANAILPELHRALGELPASVRIVRVVIRAGAGGRCLVGFVLGQGQPRDVAVVAERLMSRVAHVAGVVAIDESKPEMRGRSPRVTPLVGESEISERIAGLEIRAGVTAFLQVNTAQAGRLYEEVVRMAALARGDRALDLFCGVGAITMLLARASGSATGVEIAVEAVLAAEGNAQRNGIAGCRFIRSDAERALAAFAEERERFAVIVMNPPRAGLAGALVPAIARVGARRLVYVSCNPTTLARDLQRFAQEGYRPAEIVPFDLFPQTFHVETVVLLSRAE